ncbi:hypothetical protein [Caulobacter hibisci]|uniref:17 kDa surface antigen n=1 Tax=Caulobacter hibisci TaxID=2035993 RepID=A0ABS0T036_9CAUL|nr:hypothetical protein [Caulobacter hibisci]MBI1685247.1 hypothetical protein [Caulobacter hibisci]
MAVKSIKTVGVAAAKTLGVLAAVTLVAASTQASAQDWRRHRNHGRDSGDVAAAAIVGGIVGLAIGSSINNDRPRHSRPAYGYGYGYDYPPPPPPRYYGRGYGYDDGPRRYREDCWTTRDYDRRSGAVYERTVCR